jgi:hypothetical protein
MIRRAGCKAAVIALVAWVPLPAHADADQPVDSSAVFTPAAWQTAKKKPAPATPPASKTAPQPPDKKKTAEVKPPRKAAEVKQPLKHSDLNKDRQHPQVQRARALLNSWMGRRYGMDWRLRGTEPPQHLKVLAVNQASEEYQQYYALALALRSSLKQSDIKLLSMRSLAAIDLRSACEQVRKLGDPIDKATPKSRKQRANAELAGALLSQHDPPQARVAGCHDRARTLLATARRLQKAFGPLDQWSTAERIWIQPALTSADSSVASTSANKRPKSARDKDSNDTDDAQAKTPTMVPVLPDLSQVSKRRRISSKNVPARVRVLGY